MIDKAAVNAAMIRQHLIRLVRAAPGAFRDDLVFRYTALGACLALLAALADLGHPGARVPSAPPPPATLGASYADRRGAAQSAAPTAVPIGPSRSVDGLKITQDPRGQPDRFGTLRGAQPRNAEPHEGTP